MRTVFQAAVAIVSLSLVHSGLAGHKPPDIRHPDTNAGDVTEWSSDTPTDPDAGIYPVGGSDQVNGNFVIDEKDGVQIGIRASRRFSADPLESERDGNRGVYYAETGISSEPDRAVWSFDFHLDLRDATDKYAGTTLGDYDFYLETDVLGEDITIDADLFWGGTSLPNALLLQVSWNPAFFNDVAGEPLFDPFVPGIYEFTLKLKPRFHHASSLHVQMYVIVEEL